MGPNGSIKSSRTPGRSPADTPGDVEVRHLDPKGPEVDRMAASAGRAAEFLKSLGHEQRLMILCHLVSGEKSVGELEEALGARQAAVSQQLARLRHEGLVTTRREGKTVYYGLGDEKSERMIGLLYELFCRVE